MMLNLLPVSNYCFLFLVYPQQVANVSTEVFLLTQLDFCLVLLYGFNSDLLPQVQASLIYDCREFTVLYYN